MNELSHSFERSVVICAERTTVFGFFTDSERFAAWWGPGSSIEGRAGGKVKILYPNAVAVGGEVLEFVNGERIIFTYGYESGKPIPVGSSRVTITLSDHPEGTEVRLRHEFADASICKAHEGGWRYQLALFANAVCNVQHRGYVQLLDEYFRVWNNPDASARAGELGHLVAPDVRFRDAYGCVVGRKELEAHIGAVRQFMPGMNIERQGEAVQCQGSAMARWIATKDDGTEAARGTNLFHFTPEGRIHSIVGFWMPA